MADKKIKYPRHTTPRGFFIYPKFKTPDTKFDAEGVYTGKLRLSADKAAALIEMIDTACEEKFVEEFGMSSAEANKLSPAQKKAKKIADIRAPYVEELTKDTLEPTGNFIFSFKTKAEGKNSKTGETWSNKPAMFDAKGKPCDVDLYTSAEGKISFILMSYSTAIAGTGVQLRPKAVQVLKLADRKAGQDADAFGFGEEEEGFDSDEGSGFEGSGFDSDSTDSDDTSTGGGVSDVL